VRLDSAGSGSESGINRRVKLRDFPSFFAENAKRMGHPAIAPR
jgi:hypothetical protein